MRGRILHLLVLLVVLIMPLIVVFHRWFLTSDMPNAFEGLLNLSMLSSIKQFVTKFHSLPLWISLRNSGMPLSFLLLPGWWVWQSPLILVTLAFDEVVATKTVFFLFAFLSSVSMYLYARSLTGSRVGSVLAGWIYSSAGIFATFGLTHVSVNVAMFWASVPLFFFLFDKLFLKKADICVVAAAALVGWLAFSSQPLLFATFSPFFILHLGFRLYLKIRQSKQETPRDTILRLSFLVVLFALLNLWWIVPQFKYESLYLTPIYLSPSGYTSFSPLNAPTFVELLTMQTFAGGGTEILKDASVSGIRSIGFFLPFSLSLSAPFLARKIKEKKPDVYYFSAVFTVTFLISIILILFGLPFPTKVVAYPFLASVLTAFFLDYAIRMFPRHFISIHSRPKLKRVLNEGPLVITFSLISILILSAGYPEMFRLAQTFEPPKELADIYDFIIVSSPANSTFSVLNVPITAPVGKPYYSQLKKDDFIGSYYSYLADYETVRRGLRNAYGAMNEYEVNRYVSGLFSLLDEALRNGYYNDFVKLLRFSPNLKYIVVYRELVDENFTSFLDNDPGFKLAYQNQAAYVFERIGPYKAKSVWISESPLMITVDPGDMSSMKLVANLLADARFQALPLFVFKERTSRTASVSVSFSDNVNKARFWAFESENIVNSENATSVLHLFASTEASPSGGKSVVLSNKEKVRFDFEVPQIGQFNVSFRIMSYAISDTAFYGTNVMSFRMDGTSLGNHTVSDQGSPWKWVNFTLSTLTKEHNLEISFLGNPSLKNLIDVTVMSTGLKWDELLSFSMQRTIEVPATAAGYDIFTSIPSNISAPILLATDEAYFPSWTLTEKNRDCSPVVVNGFLTGFIVSDFSGCVQIRFLPSLGESAAFLVSLSTFVVIITFLPLYKVAKKTILKDRKTQKKWRFWEVVSL